MNKKKIKVLSSLLLWRIRRNINFRTFVLILSFVVGILSGLAAVILKIAVHETSELLTHWFNEDKVNYINVIYPMVGILITVLFVKYFVKDNIGHGISKILYAISKKKQSYIRPQQLFLDDCQYFYRWFWRFCWTGGTNSINRFINWFKHW